jgi:methyltransferase-like protein
MDFLRNRMFRQTLLCHQDQRPIYGLKGERIFDFYIASAARPMSRPADFRSNEPLKFQTPGGVTLESREPLTKAAVTLLSEAWPGSIAFRTLLKETKKLLETREQREPTEAEAHTLATQLLGIYGSASNSLIELNVAAPRFTTAIENKPVASPLARWQAARLTYATNLRHEMVGLSDMERIVVRCLDGSIDRKSLPSKCADVAAQEGVGVKEFAQARDGAGRKDATFDDLILGLAKKALLILHRLLPGNR